jgi:hypothetical protein
MGWGGEGGLSLYKGNHRTKTHEQPPVSHAAKNGIKKDPLEICKYNFIFFLCVGSQIGKEDLNCLKWGK